MVINLKRETKAPYHKSISDKGFLLKNKARKCPNHKLIYKSKTIIIVKRGTNSDGGFIISSKKNVSIPDQKS